MVLRTSVASGFVLPGRRSVAVVGSGSGCAKSSLAAKKDGGRLSPDALEAERNAATIDGLLEELGTIVDRWIMNGSPVARAKAYGLKVRIEAEAMDPETARRAARLMTRAGMPLDEPPPPAPTPTPRSRSGEASERKEWELGFRTANEEEEEKSSKRSAISDRLPGHLSSSSTASEKARSFTDAVGNADPAAFAADKVALQKELAEEGDGDGDQEERSSDDLRSRVVVETAASVARAGGGDAFSGGRLGVGGLDDVLAEIRRRVWVPLAAPPRLLEELGVRPVRGLLLHGPPGCGKTLLARTIGSLLSPDRPVTVVSGPEIMDKFVGSSEKNLRALFDEPPPLRETTGDARVDLLRAAAALHVIVLDEFDAIARARGAGGASQGDAGVARDSVVNQLLAKMDGVEPPATPTLLVGLTNKRDLVDSALLRPGRFEVQIAVPPPDTVERREAVLDVHLRTMVRAGRVATRDAPEGTPAWRRTRRTADDGRSSDQPSLAELRRRLAEASDGMSGASLAGVCRAAASRALERAVEGLAAGTTTDVDDCLVTSEDFDRAIEDVRASTADEETEQEDEENDGEKEDDVEEEEDKDESSPEEEPNEADANDLVNGSL